MAVQTKIQHRRDTAANWTTANAVLAAGEMGFETDTLKFKIGNGSTAWTSLAYQGSTFNGGTITNALTISNSLTLTSGGSVSANTFTSTSPSSAPFFISSTVRVANLNVATSGSTSNVLGGAAGSLLYQSAANTTTYLAATATNTQVLAYNTATNAPFWQTITGTGNVVYSTSPTISSPSITTSITTTSTTFNLVNTTATTIHFGRVASTMHIGKQGGVVNIYGETSIPDAGLSVGGGGVNGFLDLVGPATFDGTFLATDTITGGNFTTAGSITRTALANGGTTTASFSNTGTLIRTVSSERYKQDIQNAYYVYEDVLSLSPKTFRLKDEVESDPGSRVYAGLIAEDVDQIESLKVFVNYLTLEDGSRVPDGIAYGEMVSAVVSAIKHQDTIIKNLEARIEQLEA